MEIGTTTSQIVLNVAIQVLNMALFFWVVIKFLGKPLSKDIHARIEKEKRLNLADETYQKMIVDAQQQASDILKEASSHKDNLIRQGEQLGKQRSSELLQEAERKADNIIDTANKQANLAFEKLENHFVSAVESTTRNVVKKIFSDKKIEDAYLDELITEFTKTAKK